MEIRNSLGLHVRPASELAKLAQTFTCRIRLVAGRDDVDARSVMGLMTLGLEQGAKFELRAEGDDDAAAVAALSELVERGFDEK